jgi:hypothetical protein
MATVLYRKRGGEVLKISRSNFGFPDADPDYYAVLHNPQFTNGMDIKEQRANGTEGPAREFGFAKIALPATNKVRNATQSEITTFSDEETLDTDSQHAQAAERLLRDHPVFKKAWEAILEEADAPGVSRVANATARLRGKRSGVR